MSTIPRLPLLSQPVYVPFTEIHAAVNAARTILRQRRDIANDTSDPRCHTLQSLAQQAEKMQSIRCDCADHSPELAWQHRELQQALRSWNDALTATPAQSALSPRADSLGSKTERSRSQIISAFIKAVQVKAGECGYAVKVANRWWGLGGQTVTLSIPLGSPFFDAKTFFSSALDRVGLRFAIWPTLFDLENKQLSRLIRIGNFDESGWWNDACQVVMRLVHPSAEQGATVTLEFPRRMQNEIKGVSSNRVEVRCENELPDEELLFNIDGQSLPLLDSISEVQRQIVDLEGRKISVKGIRFTNMYGLDDPRYLHGGMGIDFKVTKKDAPHIGDVARFLGARLFGTDQFVAHGQGFELALDGVRVLISVNQELGRGHISFEPTQAFENGATLLTLDAALLNLMRYPKPASSFTPQENPQRDQFIEFNSQTPFTLDDLLEKHAEAVPPATAPTLRVREEAMKAFTGQLGSGVPANQQHRRFHLLLRGKYPVLLTINAGNDVARWSIRLDMSRSFKNGKAHEALVAFLGELLGVDFRQGSVGVALHAYEEAMLPNSTYDAKVAGLGSLRLDLFAGDGISCAVAFEPSERGYLPEVTLAFLNGLYEKLRGLEQWEPSHQI